MSSSEDKETSQEASGDQPSIPAPTVTHKCSRPGCENNASMACPTCIKLGLPPSRFCGQECFKSYWGVHKVLHKPAVDPSTMPAEFQYYEFSGKLRPYQKTAMSVVPPHIVRPDYADHPNGIPISENADRRSNTTIKVYTKSEIDRVRAVCLLGREIIDIAGAAVKVGITTDEIDKIVHQATIERDAYPSPLNYHQFPKSVCTSVNEVICHGIPDLRPLQDGDIVNIDVSVYKDGYHADLNETFFVGNVDKDSVRLVECAYNALAAAIDGCKPGALYRYRSCS